MYAAWRQPWAGIGFWVGGAAVIVASGYGELIHSRYTSAPPCPAAAVTTECRELRPATVTAITKTDRGDAVVSLAGTPPIPDATIPTSSAHGRGIPLYVNQSVQAELLHGEVTAIITEKGTIHAFAALENAGLGIATGLGIIAMGLVHRLRRGRWRAKAKKP